MRTLHQAAIGDEIADLREAADIVDLILNHKSEDLSDTRYAAKQVHCHRVVFRYLGVDLPFDSEDLLVNGVHERYIDLDAGTNHRVREAYPNADAVGSAIDAVFKGRQIVLGVGVLDMRLKLCFLTSYVQPAAKEIRVERICCG